ncbi:hypothetical protein Tco_1281617, partial [Tanacetum coccineum]
RKSLSTEGFVAAEDLNLEEIKFKKVLKISVLERKRFLLKKEICYGYPTLASPMKVTPCVNKKKNYDGPGRKTQEQKPKKAKAKNTPAVMKKRTAKQRCWDLSI